MSTIIDALLVTLSLDPSAFKSGAKDAEKSLKDTGDNADRQAKLMEAKGKQAAQFFGQIRNQVLALAAVFTAGMGIKEFIAHTTATDAAVGRTARNIGISTETLTAWQGVAERAGGTAAGMAGSMQGLAQQFQQLLLTGTSAVVPYFRTLGVDIADANGKMRSQDAILLDLADKFKVMTDAGNAAQAQAFGAGLGIDEGTVNVLMQGREALGQMLAEQKKLGAANAADSKVAAERQKEYNALSQAATDLGRKLLTTLTPAIIAVVKGLTAIAGWFAEHRTVFALVAGAVATAAALLTAALFSLRVRGLLAVISALKAVPAAAAVTDAALTTTAATATAAGTTMAGAFIGVLSALAKLALYAYAAHEALKLVDEHDDFGTWMDEKFRGASWLDNAASKIGLGRSYAEQAEASKAAKARAEAKEKGLPVSSDNSTVTVIAPAKKRVLDQQKGSDAPRGIRNNNPGNLNFVGQQGATKEGGGGRFAVFESMEQGIAALGKQLQIYQSRGTDSVQAIISKYAPPGENNTDAYIASVAKKLGVGANDHLDLRDPAILKGMITAITDVEVGKNKLTVQQIDGGIVAMNPSARPTYAQGLPLDPAMRGGAAMAMAANNTTNHQVSTSTSHAETHIDRVNVIVPDADKADRIGKGISDAIEKHMAIAQQANFGLVS